MRGVCFYACACSARRENAGTLVRSAFRQEQSLSRSFSLRGGGLRRFSFCKAICTTPRKLCGVFVFMPAPALRVVKMRGHSFAPRSVRNSRSLVHFHSAGAACAAFLFARQFAQHPASYAGCLFLCLTDWGVLNPLLPFGLSSPVTEQLKLALRGKVNFAACLTLGCSFYPTKKSKISLWGPLLHLPKCGTYITFLLRVCFSHSHNRADDGTN